MSPLISPLVWDELLAFALGEDEPSLHKSIRAALDDFGIDTGTALRRIMAALRRLEADGRGEPSAHSTGE